jgi:arylsulfatase A-like enzyme
MMTSSVPYSTIRIPRAKWDPVSGYLANAFTRFAAGLCLIGLLSGAAPPPTAPTLQRVFSLTQFAQIERAADIPAACVVGDDLRPAFGCAKIHIFGTELKKIDDNSVHIVGTTPLGLRGKTVLLLPSVEHGPATLPDAFPARIETKLGARTTLELPFDSNRLRRRSQALLLAKVLPPAQQQYETTPLKIPEGAHLEVGLAVSTSAPQSNAAPTRFVVEALWDDQRRELLRESLDASQGDVWHERRIDLSDLGGHDARFRFTTTAAAYADQEQASAAFPVWGSPQILAPRARDGRPNVVLISLDTVRADHLGGSLRGVRLTPWFDELARAGTIFDQAVSTFSSTTASHMSLFTGVYPATHRVRYPTHQLSADLPTLPQILNAAGYATAAVTENGMILGQSGFARGFDSYRENKHTLAKGGAIDRTFAAGVEWVEKHRTRPFLLFLHSYEAHTPYTPTAEVLSVVPEVDPVGLSPEQLSWQTSRRAYAAEIRYSDLALKGLFASLRRLKVLDDTVVVILSDHGEEFGEHGGTGHARTVFDEILRVPLLFWAPNRVPEGRRVSEQVSLIDVAPTILDLVGAEPLTQIPGKSLQGAMRGRPLPENNVHFAEGSSGNERQIAARTLEHKWVWTSKQELLRVFDLKNDPGEQVALDDEELLAKGQTLIDDYLTLDKEAPANGATLEDKELPLDATIRAKLKALGYID